MKNVNINNITDSPLVRLYVDSVDYNNDFYKLSGWVGIFKGEVKEFLNYECSVQGLKQGAVDLFNKRKIPLTNKNMKFTLNIRKKDIFRDVKLLLTDNTIIKIGSLSKWVVYYSGFNKITKDLVVVDDFYQDPDLIREWTMNNLTFRGTGASKGERSQRFSIAGTKEKFEKILGTPIRNWDYKGYANETFQFCTADQQTVYHMDRQKYAGMIFLSPNAPATAGTNFYRSRITGRTSFPDRNTTKEGGELWRKSFTGSNKELNFYDGTQHELIDRVGNKYNRLVLFNAQQIHAAGDYFGDSIKNARYFHIFFFDI